VQAKNSFENYIFSMKNTLADEKLKDKFTESDKQTIEQQTKDALQWLDGNPSAEKEDLERKQKEMEEVLNPIMVRIYQTSAAP
jgi:heat shock 70kDa protein 1/2/6/8